jgi:hypothetical protein
VSVNVNVDLDAGSPIGREAAARARALVTARAHQADQATWRQLISETVTWAVEGTSLSSADATRLGERAGALMLCLTLVAATAFELPSALLAADETADVSPDALRGAFFTEAEKSGWTF